MTWSFYVMSLLGVHYLYTWTMTSQVFWRITRIIAYQGIKLVSNVLPIALFGMVFAKMRENRVPHVNVRKLSGTHSPLHAYPPRRFFGHVNINIVGALAPSENCQYILTMVDRATLWPEAVPLSDIFMQEHFRWLGYLTIKYLIISKVIGCSVHFSVREQLLIVFLTKQLLIDPTVMGKWKYSIATWKLTAHNSFRNKC